MEDRSGVPKSWCQHTSTAQRTNGNRGSSATTDEALCWSDVKQPERSLNVEPKPEQSEPESRPAAERQRATRCSGCVREHLLRRLSSDSNLSLSETRSGRIGGAIRPGLAPAKCGRRSRWGGLPENPYSRIGAFGF